ncbi:hypothetical protein [Candidatus Solirubrobacter pratensis]|uniref:hypothetical protein n=1 Tax=Candidatus Solirubrobacter pratensis TaxID=1298857 RepID=UPI0004261102|nr:hypothetical protein [Candidatus Solirubrobacter pratensis]
MSLLPRYLPEKTVKYKTFLKSSVQDGLARVFANHPDDALRTTPVARQDGTHGTEGVKVTLEWPRDKDRYPCVVVRFFERDIQSVGVGHQEMIFVEDDDLIPMRMLHNIFTGDLEFAIYALSNLDRDLMSDTVVQTLTMGTISDYTNNFFNAVYADQDNVPDARWHFIDVSKKVSGFGETQAPVPWQSEDEQLYIVQYRAPVTGEFYSVPPENRSGDYVRRVPIYPWIEDLETEPTGATDTGEWV